ncbi:hypothetical protein GGR53DRAFT_512816 [Hypoxylon sp. FL1150]|nr:hypothetical protein GGR53DRAFT_512816 [Hypoxylon sp. FL1150]
MPTKKKDGLYLSRKKGQNWVDVLFYRDDEKNSRGQRKSSHDHRSSRSSSHEPSRGGNQHGSRDPTGRSAYLPPLPEVPTLARPTAGPGASGPNPMIINAQPMSPPYVQARQPAPTPNVRYSQPMNANAPEAAYGYPPDNPGGGSYANNDTYAHGNNNPDMNNDGYGNNDRYAPYGSGTASYASPYQAPLVGPSGSSRPQEPYYGLPYSRSEQTFHHDDDYEDHRYDTSGYGRP